VKNQGVHRYRESALKAFTGIFATTLSSLLPIVSIVVLYVVHSMPARLGIIAGFTAGFSLIVSIIMSATRSENFAATAA
jgi:zinc transporter ZupT